MRWWLIEKQLRRIDLLGWQEESNRQVYRLFQFLEKNIEKKLI